MMNLRWTISLMWVAMACAQLNANAVDRPTTAIPWRGCVTEACHVTVRESRVLHGPVNVNACDACHRVQSVQEHTFSLTREPEQLCGFCHQLDDKAPVQHKPVTDGQCLSCHDPHGGRDSRFLRGNSMEALCASCHQDVKADKSFVHGPVAAGACNVCHAPHAAEHPNLLPAVGRDLCVSCHLEMDQELKNTTFVHEPAKSDCAQCHDPHASNHTMMVKDEPFKLCTSCHEPIAKAVEEAKFKHSAVTQDATCTNCHTSHGSDLRSLMRDQPAKLCLNCHGEAITIDEQRTIAAVSEILDPALVKHGPVGDGTCSGCHQVHGGDISRLLNKPYPEVFYSPFELERFELCFSCHDQQLVLQPRTDALTGFRNGEVNLHFVHVNKERRGRTCRACHNTHASNNPLHIRESVPYGAWQLPINFARSDTGGSCAPGCHQELGYDRQTPVDPTAAPASLRPAEAPETTR